ncbi:hypothetical protein B0J14DRAFT_563500 [Halenospora varia]|nr:hypothetical protein B0J14DRAFT_563500 [Halenospora varia]
MRQRKKNTAVFPRELHSDSANQGVSFGDFPFDIQAMIFSQCDLQWQQDRSGKAAAVMPPLIVTLHQQPNSCRRILADFSKVHDTFILTQSNFFSLDMMSQRLKSTIKMMKIMLPRLPDRRIAARRGWSSLNLYPGHILATFSGTNIRGLRLTVENRYRVSAESVREFSDFIYGFDQWLGGFTALQNLELYMPTWSSAISRYYESETCNEHDWWKARKMIEYASAIVCTAAEVEKEYKNDDWVFETWK